MSFRRLLVLLATLALYAAGLIVTCYVTPDWTARQTAAVVLTGAVVIWYTWETMLLREVAMAQREQQLRPFVVFSGNAHGHSVENVGATPALGVTIKPVSFRAPSLGLDISFPTPIALLRPGQSLPIETKVVVNGHDVETIFAARLDPNYAVEDVDVVLRFRSIEGKAYELVQTTAPKSMTVRGFRQGADASQNRHPL